MKAIKEDQVRKCPRCGSTPTVDAWVFKSDRLPHYRFSCERCGFNSEYPGNWNKSAALNQWNLRASETFVFLTLEYCGEEYELEVKTYLDRISENYYGKGGNTYES